MNKISYLTLATLGSAAVLLGAYGFQHLGGLAPCKMCLWQRWPHAAAILIGILALTAIKTRYIALAGALASFITGAIGVYHAGVEQKWWEGPNTCTAGSTEGLNSSDLLDQILAAPVVRCDDIAWSLMGISMAGWNAIVSFILVALWSQAFRKAT
jgi:disulfide bond formation protein DsbB